MYGELGVDKGVQKCEGAGERVLLRVRPGAVQGKESEDGGGRGRQGRNPDRPLSVPEYLRHVHRVQKEYLDLQALDPEPRKRHPDLQPALRDFGSPPGKLPEPGVGPEGDQGKSQAAAESESGEFPGAGEKNTAAVFHRDKVRPAEVLGGPASHRRAKIRSANLGSREQYNLCSISLCFQVIEFRGGKKK